MKLTFCINKVMPKSEEFRRWFGPILENSGVKQKKLAARADIAEVSLSRILSGAQGVSKDTAVNLARSLNEMTGRTVADEDTALRLVVGLPPSELNGLFNGIKDLSPSRQALATRQIRGIIDALADEQEHDFDYIDDEEAVAG